MLLYAPAYYKNFKCIADKCTHSCCIGWEIDIDRDTYEKYAHLSGGYGEVIKNSISAIDTPHFKLGEGDRCPHLNDCGLCKIILNVGEDHLCDICREHPRFYNFTTVSEVGVGMSCIEAARLILSSPDYATIENIGEMDAVADDLDFDGRADRAKIYEILQSGEDYMKSLEKIFSEYQIELPTDEEYLEIIDSLEYLDHNHKKLFMNYSSTKRPVGQDEYSERFLAYFIYRHCTEAFDEYDFRDRLSFCLFCERLFSSLVCSENVHSLDDVATIASIISEEIEYSDDNTCALMP